MKTSGARALHERLAPVRSRADWLAGLALDLGPVAPAETRAWDEYRLSTMTAAFPRLGAVFLIAAVLWWPTDLITFAAYPDAQRAMSLLRGGASLATLLFMAVLALSPRARQHPVLAGLLTALPEAAFAGYCMATAGDPGGPWPHFLYLISFVSFALLVPLGHRVMAAFALNTAAFLTYFLTRPEYLHHPLMSSVISFGVFAAILATVLGHTTYYLMRTSFLRGLRLRGLSDQLESRVASQTAELRALANRIETLREEERSWMAREIHDELGQELSALRFATEFARGRVAQSPVAGLRAIDELDQLIARTHDTVRRIIRYLRPRVLDELGPVAAIEWLVSELASRGGIDARLVLPEERLVLDPDRATALFRSAQELLTNVAKHAGASWVVVTLAVTTAADVTVAVDGPEVHLTVENDGGSLPERATSFGSGMTGTRERVAALGGTASWTNRQDGGVRATITLPLATSHRGGHDCPPTRDLPSRRP